MELNEERLRLIVNEIIDKIKSEEEENLSISPKTRMYIVLIEPWTEEYISILSTLKQCYTSCLNIVIPEKFKQENFYDKIISISNNFQIKNHNEIDLDVLKNYTTVFPLFNKNILAKTALGISDTFETKWIEKSFEKGERIVILKKGFNFFTGKEPKKYLSKMKEYYHTLIEYGIEINDEIMEKKYKGIDKIMLTKTTEKIKDVRNRIITEKEVADYIDIKEINLGKDDKITCLAKEKAENLGITIKKVR